MGKKKPFVRGIFSGIIIFLLSYLCAFGNAQNSEELYLRQLEQQREEYVSQRNGLYIEFALLAASYPRATVAVIVRDAGLTSLFKGFMEQEIPGWALIAAAIGTGFCLENENIYNCAFVSERLYDIGTQLESINEKIDNISQLVGYQVHVKNDCLHPVQLALRYQDYKGIWHSDGWWSFDGQAGASLLDGDSWLRLKSPTIDFYAETTDHSQLVWQGDASVTVGTRTLSMDEMNLPFYDTYYELRLTCDGL